ncbi:9919_t:CDS:10 [Dentiscutata erythropus]|uniref:Vacuolar protein-sorting-associated protein 36 n=1 Tax=Dentiscutata erythropus TaxID=1348616 RepID=A0A9N9GDR4_9GLOM|nr:9919_t:CDS:10 [Dentiscutata erythropus]
MNRFTRAELNSTFRPVLLYNETVLATQDNVGLYDGNEKAADYMNGTAYLTSHRIIYVDSQNPVTNSIAVEIKFIKGRDFYVRIWQAIGFVRSSPKITLRFSDTTSPYSHSDNQLYHSSPFSSVTNLQNTLPPTSSSWICPICSFINRDLQDIKCRLCGVKRIASSASSTLNVRSDFEDSVDQLQRSPSPNIPTDDIGIACKVCTFLNHPSMIKCEMCEADLRTFDVSNLDFENDLEASKNFKSAKDNDFVRLAFRDGGSNAFYEKLKSAMAAKEWEKAQETSMGIIRNAEQSQKEQKETLNQAFKDLDGLMAKTSEMVKLAESIRNKLSKELDSETSTDETSDFRTYLIELGIPNPVTKDSAGSTYHKELARQLAEFLDNLLEKENGMMSLTDIYCLFNRALKHGRHDSESRQAIIEQLQRHEDLKRKIHDLGSDEELDDVSSESNNEEDESVIKEKAFDELAQYQLKDSADEEPVKAKDSVKNVDNNLGRMIFGVGTKEKGARSDDSSNARVSFNQGPDITTLPKSTFDQKKDSEASLLSEPGYNNDSTNQQDESQNDSEEINPWLQHDTSKLATSSKKVNKSINIKNSNKLNKLASKLNKQKREMQMKEDVEIDMNKIITVQVADNTKKEVKTAATDKSAIENVNVESDNDNDDNAEAIKNFVNVKNPTAFTQRELVARAFANDNVVEEFESEKQAIIDEDMPKEKDITLPGWAKKYLSTDIPHPFETREQYERSLRTPIGKEWNTNEVFQKMITPRVVTKMGVVIDPLKVPFKTNAEID